MAASDSCLCESGFVKRLTVYRSAECCCDLLGARASLAFSIVSQSGAFGN